MSAKKNKTGKEIVVGFRKQTYLKDELQKERTQMAADAPNAKLSKAVADTRLNHMAYMRALSELAVLIEEYVTQFPVTEGIGVTMAIHRNRSGDMDVAWRIAEITDEGFEILARTSGKVITPAKEGG